MNGPACRSASAAGVAASGPTMATCPTARKTALFAAPLNTLTCAPRLTGLNAESDEDGDGDAKRCSAAANLPTRVDCQPPLVQQDRGEWIRRIFHFGQTLSAAKGVVTRDTGWVMLLIHGGFGSRAGKSRVHSGNAAAAHTCYTITQNCEFV